MKRVRSVKAAPLAPRRLTFYSDLHYDNDPCWRVKIAIWLMRRLKVDGFIFSKGQRYVDEARQDGYKTCDVVVTFHA